MNDNVTTFLANLRHDIRNNRSVEVGSGIFSGQELVDVANALAAGPALLNALTYLIDGIERSEGGWAAIDRSPEDFYELGVAP